MKQKLGSKTRIQQEMERDYGQYEDENDKVTWEFERFVFVFTIFLLASIMFFLGVFVDIFVLPLTFNIVVIGIIIYKVIFLNEG